MKNVIDPQILVIQKVSTVITRERDVEALLESVLSILESDLGMIRGTSRFCTGTPCGSKSRADSPRPRRNSDTTALAKASPATSPKPASAM